MPARGWIERGTGYTTATLRGSRWLRIGPIVTEVHPTWWIAASWVSSMVITATVDEKEPQA